MKYNLLIIKKNLSLELPREYSTHYKRIILSLKGTKIVNRQVAMLKRVKKNPLPHARGKGDSYNATA